MNVKLKHKNTIIGILVFFLTLAAIFAIKSVLSSDEGKAIYGDRLDGRKDVEISDDTKKEVQEKLSAKASSTDVSVAGRIINIIVAANDISLDDAKKLGNETLDVFSDQEKKYYDIQIFVTNKNNTAQFPIIGYKQHNNKAFSWTKDRQES